MQTKDILIVDDDETFSLTLARVIKRAGYSGHTAHSISEAKSLAFSVHPEYAIVDLKIAHESGLDLIPILLEINQDMRILILTGFASIATAVEAIKLGAIQYLTKPVESKEILNVLIDDIKPSTEIPENPISVKRLEWEHLQKVLQENNGNVSATAKALNMHRRTLQRKLQKPHIEAKLMS
ncbi:MAG: response regulator transcription factor [Gammaproteobacteria bacterium]|nr:response regulator transcription factor [Gammaproteobacteria bacterium]